MDREIYTRQIVEHDAMWAERRKLLPAHAAYGATDEFAEGHYWRVCKLGAGSASLFSAFIVDAWGRTWPGLPSIPFNDPSLWLKIARGPVDALAIARGKRLAEESEKARTARAAASRR